MLRKFTAILKISLILSSSVYADCQSQLDLCKDTLEACDVVVDKRKKEVQLCNLGLLQQRDVIANLQIDNRRKDEQLSAWYRNPFVVGLLGIAVGGFATVVITR